MFVHLIGMKIGCRNLQDAHKMTLVAGDANCVTCSASSTTCTSCSSNAYLEINSFTCVFCEDYQFVDTEACTNCLCIWCFVHPSLINRWTGTYPCYGCTGPDTNQCTSCSASFGFASMADTSCSACGVTKFSSNGDTSCTLCTHTLESRALYSLLS